ncbi:hypothetical protein TNIN_375631 [Trichonephila inaurata madagascariensis]|uniref:Uncharacterized protein n=1 Tax=Trichonephila inaurata madagascariensis TaxID=2747483 RepID=A0A8X6YB46_9ARAC|nr:hypothetical protein TNIN_375631 [Trichonephila inaurata madagascariensis]
MLHLIPRYFTLRSLLSNDLSAFLPETNLESTFHLHQCSVVVEWNEMQARVQMVEHLSYDGRLVRILIFYEGKSKQFNYENHCMIFNKLKVQYLDVSFSRDDVLHFDCKLFGLL